MKLMKQKWISIITVIAVLGTLLSGFSVFGAEKILYEAPQVNKITETEEDFLLHLGIIRTPFPEERDDYMARETTRGALAQMMSRVAGLEPYTGTEMYFSDVPTSHLYYKEISALARVGILKGDGNGGFRPDDPVTPEEMVTVCSIILGYTIVGENETYPVVANRIGLYDGVELSGNLTIGQFYRMLLTTLDTEMMEQTGFGEKTEFKVVKNYTCLERYHGLVKQKGIVDGAFGTRLSDVDNTMRENQIMINGQVFQYNETDGLLGKAVVFYSQRDKATGGTKKDILFLYEDGERNSALRILGEDVDGFEGRYFKYYEGKNERRVQMTEMPDVIANGIAYPEYKPEDLKPDCGSVTLLDNNGDNIYDVVMIEEYQFMMIDSVNVADGVIYGRYPEGAVVGSKNRESNYKVIMEDGIVGELGFLIPGDMIAVQSSKNLTGTQLVTVTYLGEGTTGVLEGFYKDTYTISGVSYQVTGATAMDKDEYVLGQTLSVYTFGDYCAALIHPSNDGYKFGYMVDANYRESGFSGVLAVRIVSQNREMLEPKIGKKLILDESEYTDMSRAMDQIKAAADLRVYSAGLQKAVEATSTTGLRTEFAVAFNRGSLTQLKEGEAEFPYSQPVRYRLNDAGELTHLDTMIKGANESEQSLTPFQTNGGTAQEEMDGGMYNYYDRSFYPSDGAGSIYATLISTGNIIMPPFKDRDELAWYGNGNLTNEQYYIVEAYSVNEYRKARYALVYQNVQSGVAEENQIYIIGDVNRTLNEDGEIIRQVVLYGNGGPYTREVASEVPDSDLVVGNLVRFQSNLKNEVVAIETYYRVADGDPDPSLRIKDSGESRIYGKRNRMAYGTVLSYSDNIITHVTSVGADLYKKENLRNYVVSSGGFYKYTNKGGNAKVENVSAAEMIPYDNDRTTTQRAIMVTYIGRLDIVYIIERD